MPSALEQVRRFNRTVTQRVGALNDKYLARDRPLGEARVLWEIGPDGCEVRALRSRLDLDSGHLSRLLRALEADGLVAGAWEHPERRSRRFYRATPAGEAERDRLAAELGPRLDRIAGSIRSIRAEVL
jgi:DNA-binding MarR family transcriptional regulator